MWLVKKVAIKCTNIARELAQHLDKPNETHWRAVARVVGYLIHRKKSGNLKDLRLRKPKTLKIEAWCDSDYGSNKDNRRSVTGYIVTLGGCIVNWQSKTQKSVSLSSTEAEYAALSMCAAECKFVNMLVDEMTKGQILPYVIHEDNMGAIFMINNPQVGQSTKHIDIRYHFSKELVEEGKLKIEYVNSPFNYADIMTKGVTEKTFQTLMPNIKTGNMIH